MQGIAWQRIALRPEIRALFNPWIYTRHSARGLHGRREDEVGREDGVRIGDVDSQVRGTKAVRVMRERKGDTEYTTVEMKFGEH